MKHAAILAGAAFALFQAAGIHAQSGYPTRVVRVVIRFAAGGNTDLVARGTEKEYA